MALTPLNFQTEFQERRGILSRNFVAKRRESDSELEKMELKKLKSKNGKRNPIIQNKPEIGWQQ